MDETQRFHQLSRARREAAVFSGSRVLLARSCSHGATREDRQAPTSSSQAQCRRQCGGGSSRCKTPCSSRHDTWRPRTCASPSTGQDGRLPRGTPIDWDAGPSKTGLVRARGSIQARGCPRNGGHSVHCRGFRPYRGVQEFWIPVYRCRRFARSIRFRLADVMASFHTLSFWSGLIQPMSRFGSSKASGVDCAIVRTRTGFEPYLTV